MHTWRITFRTEPGGRRLVADVDADDVDVEARGVHLVLWRTQLVVGRVQRVIVWRLRRDEATVEPLCSGGQRATHEPLSLNDDGHAPYDDARLHV